MHRLREDEVGRRPRHGYLLHRRRRANLTNPDTIENARYRLEAETYLEKAAQYGMPEATVTKGFGASGWIGMMTPWEQAGIAARNGELTQESFKEHLAGTSDNHISGSVPFGCADAVAPYTAICSPQVSLTQWDGETLVPIIEVFSGVDLVAGTELKPGP